MFDHLDAKIAAALALEGMTDAGHHERKRRRRAIIAAIGLVVTAAVTMAAAVSFSEEPAPVVASATSVPHDDTVATTTPAAPPATVAPTETAPPTTVAIVTPAPAPTVPPATVPPTPATPPPTVPPAAPPAALEWSMSAPGETVSSEDPFPVTITVHNPSSVRLQYVAVQCDRVRRVQVGHGNVLSSDLADGKCTTNVQFAEPGGLGPLSCPHA